MKHKNFQWSKLGLIIGTNSKVSWLAGGSGPCCAIPNKQDTSIVDLYVSGRDIKNRSRIGLIRYNLKKLSITEIIDCPVIDLGDIGTFDQNGTSYPFVVREKNRLLMYYTGWIKGVHVPWYNDLGLALSKDGISFKKFSKSPIFFRNNLDYLNIGSCCALIDNYHWRMWYTRFEKWNDKSSTHPFFYNIKSAYSTNGINWQPDNLININFKNNDEYVISKPHVLKINNKYIMWYCFRGKYYELGFAISNDGLNWKRFDERVGISVSEKGWDSEMICYPHVFDGGKYFYMFYCGNKYGVEGLGLAQISKKNLLELINV